MREIRTSGSMSEKWRRSTAANMRHRQPKGPATARLSLTHRATSRLYKEVGAAVTADGGGDGVDEMATGDGLGGIERAVVEVVEQAGDGDKVRTIERGAGASGVAETPGPRYGAGVRAGPTLGQGTVGVRTAQ